MLGNGQYGGPNTRLRCVSTKYSPSMLLVAKRKCFDQFFARKTIVREQPDPDGWVGSHRLHWAPADPPAKPAGATIGPAAKQLSPTPLVADRLPPPGEEPGSERPNRHLESG
jgi:hypothetical protein